MSWDSAHSPAALSVALGSRDRAAAAEIIEDLRQLLVEFGERLDARVAIEVLRALRRHLEWQTMAEVGTLIVDNGADDEEIRLLLAQARIARGKSTSVIAHFRKVVEDLEKVPVLADGISAALARRDVADRIARAKVAMGDAYRTLYIAASPNALEPREHDCRRALECYEAAFHHNLDEFIAEVGTWLALSAKALAIAGRRTAAEQTALRQWANRILDEPAKRGPLEEGHLIAQLHAQLTEGKIVEAVQTTRRFLESGAEPWRIESVRNQLLQLWDLDREQPPGKHLLPLLDARLADLGERINLTAAAFEGVAGLESILDPRTPYKPVAWLRTALQRVVSVARIGVNTTLHGARGTAFVFDGACLGAVHASRKLVLTNSHVVSSDPAVRQQYGAIAPDRATLAFLGLDQGNPPRGYRIRRELFTSPPPVWDATLLEAEDLPPTSTPLPLAGRAVFKGERVTLLGHPLQVDDRGGRQSADMMVSLQDNKVGLVTADKVFYRAPTAEGSSGSPVFDDEWHLVALHHAGVAWANNGFNEGLRIERVIRAIKEAGVE